MTETNRTNNETYHYDQSGPAMSGAKTAITCGLIDSALAANETWRTEWEAKNAAIDNEIAETLKWLKEET